MENSQDSKIDITPAFKFMAEKLASDLFFSAGAPAYIKIEGELRPLNSQVLDVEMVKRAIYGIMNEEQIRTFEEKNELNFGLSVPGAGRFRINVFRQRGSVAMVARYITHLVPTLDGTSLPAVLKDMVLEKRGLILVVGATGSGKSTTLAAMINHRNANKAGHILTIEDPIEFVHKHNKSLVNQREVGIDTESYATALINALREAPDVLLIGEIRDTATMKQALIITQTGHLCLGTLHANNAYHAINRIVSFFPEEERESLLLDLSMTLKGIVSQRLVKGVDGKRVAAVEVLMNTFYVSELIQKGEVEKLKDAIEQSLNAGSQTFERSLLDLFIAGKISREEALSNADSRTDMEWLISNSVQEGGKGGQKANTAVELSEASLNVGESLEGFTINPEFLDKIGSGPSGFPKR
ncbi:twitching motility protein PilT [Sulfurimicrobium lacus]|uniref:Twitching motility protein PilT n=1 Tax=Sulfurimicrobium lacus TaxID=2715678 RepID=A0A6F8VE47_9PROT|nr:PilT/PilU family type 4a pilus ATPase [Sulfurimicrobium lacus]BCB27954.1 twitching motility protein PilT [Sulfurimicrobium lacus]